MTVKNDQVGEDELVVTLAEDGASAQEKAAPTKEELDAAAAKAAEEEDDDHEDGGEDERHAVGANEEDDKRRKNRADARRARKAARRERDEAREAELLELRQKVDALSGRVATVDKNSASQTLAIVNARIAEAVAGKEAADNALADAITKQDGKTAQEAIKARDLANEAISQLTNYKTNFENHARAAAAAPQNTGADRPDPRMVSFAKQFKAVNPWIDLNDKTDDADSQAVHRLDASVRAAGYDPASPEYWEELQRRVDVKFGDREEAEEEPAPRRAQTARPAGRRGPAMSGGRSAPHVGKNDIIVPKALKEAAGKDWNDPVKRADLVRRYKEAEIRYGAAK